MALRKHKDKILLLVKMMYSAHGTTLPCFKKGKIIIIMSFLGF
jgi:phosphatidylinositol 4-kinase